MAAGQEQDKISSYGIANDEILNKLMEPFRGVSVKDRRWHLQTYKKCFVATEAVDWLLVAGLFSRVVTRKEVEELLEGFREARWIEHVVDKEKPFSDELLFFKFTGEGRRAVAALRPATSCSSDSGFTSPANRVSVDSLKSKRIPPKVQLEKPGVSEHINNASSKAASPNPRRNRSVSSSKDKPGKSGETSTGCGGKDTKGSQCDSVCQKLKRHLDPVTMYRIVSRNEFEGMMLAEEERKRFHSTFSGLFSKDGQDQSQRQLFSASASPFSEIRPGSLNVTASLDLFGDTLEHEETFERIKPPPSSSSMLHSTVSLPSSLGSFSQSSNLFSDDSSTSMMDSFSAGISSSFSLPDACELPEKYLELATELKLLKEQYEILKLQLVFREHQLIRINPKVELVKDVELFSEFSPPQTFVGKSDHNSRGLYLPCVSWLSFLAVLAYHSPMETRRIVFTDWPKKGLPTPAKLCFFSCPENDTWAFGYHYPESHEAVLSFRGTISDENWKTNFKIKIVPLHQENGAWRYPDYKLSALSVHSGFNRAFLSIWKEVKQFIISLPRGTRFSITGHSLGGALATLCYLYLTAFYPAVLVDQVVTFGQPRCGTPMVAKFLKTHGRCNIVRIRNENDAVPLIPPKKPLGFAHLVSCQYLTVDGALVMNRPRNIGTTAKGFLGANFISDHSMALYATRLNRGLERLSRLQPDHTMGLPHGRTMRIVVKSVDLSRRIKKNYSYGLTVQSKTSEWIKATTDPFQSQGDHVIFETQLILYPVWLNDMLIFRLFRSDGKARVVQAFGTIAIHELKSVKDVPIMLHRGDPSQHEASVLISYSFTEPQGSSATGPGFFGQPLEVVNDIKLSDCLCVKALKRQDFPSPDMIMLLTFSILRCIGSVEGTFFAHTCEIVLRKLKDDIDRQDLSYLMLNDPPLPALLPRILYEWVRLLPQSPTGIDLYDRWVALGSSSQFEADLSQLMTDLRLVHPFLPFLILILCRISTMAVANKLFTKVDYDGLASQLRHVLFYTKHPQTGEKMYIAEDIPKLEQTLIRLFGFFRDSMGIVSNTNWPVYIPANLNTSPIEFLNHSLVVDIVHIPPTPRFSDGLVASLTNLGVLTFFDPSIISHTIYWCKPKQHFRKLFVCLDGSLLLYASPVCFLLTCNAISSFSFEFDSPLPLDRADPSTVLPDLSSFARINHKILAGSQHGEIFEFICNGPSKLLARTNYQSRITRMAETRTACIFGNGQGHIFTSPLNDPTKLSLAISLGCEDSPRSVATDLVPEDIPNVPSSFSPVFDSLCSEAIELDPFPVTCILPYDSHVWVCAGGSIYVLSASIDRVVAIVALPDEQQAFALVPFLQDHLMITGSATLFKIHIQTFQVTAGPLIPTLHPSHHCVLVQPLVQSGAAPDYWISTTDQVLVLKVVANSVPSKTNFLDRS